MIILRVLVVAVAVEVWLLLGHENAFQRGEFRHLLCAEVGWFVQHQAVAVAQDVGREPAAQSQAACADDGRETGLDQRLTRLEVLAGDGHSGLVGQFPHCGDVHCGVGSAHYEGSALRQCGVCVAHRGGDMLLVVSLHGNLQGGQRAVHLLVDRHIYLGRCGPKHHYALHARFLLKPADILAYLLRHVPAVPAQLHVVAVQTPGVVPVECGGHRLDLLKLVPDGIDVLLLQHLGVDGAFVCIGRIYVPGRKLYIVQVCQRHDVLIVQIFLVFSFAYADLVVLGHRAHRLGKSLAGHQHAGNERGAYRTQSHYHYSEFTIGSLSFC